MDHPQRSVRRRFVVGLSALGLSGVFIPLTPARAAEVDGVRLPDQVSVAGQTLDLLGAGKRRRFVFDVYVGGLYVPPAEKAGASAASILSGAGLRRVSLVFLRDLENAQLTEALDEGIRKNASEAEIAALSAGLKQLADLLKSLGALPKGDTLDLDLSAEQVSLTRGGKPVGSVAHKGLGRALLTAWLGDKPADENLKAAMLDARR